MTATGRSQPPTVNRKKSPNSGFTCAPIRHEHPCIRIPRLKILREPRRIGDEFGLSPRQRIRLAGALAHAVQDVGDAGEVGVAGEPVFAGHQGYGGAGVVGQVGEAVGDVAVDVLAGVGQRWVLRPVAGEQVVVVDVDEDASVAAPGGRNAVAAALEGGVGFGVAVDGAVERDATREIGRQGARQRALDPVADDTADDERRVVAGQHGVGEEVHGALIAA